MGKCRPTRLGKILLGLFGSVSCLLGLEGALRIAGVSYAPPKASIVLAPTLREARQKSPHERLHENDARQIWKPRPGAKVRGMDRETINSEGYRGPILPKERNTDALRIAFLGDSSTFGVGVPFDECYAARLAAHMEADGHRVEILDCGVIGFTVRQGLERYRALVRDYRPDIVVAGFGAINESIMAAAVSDSHSIELQAKRRSLSFRVSRFLLNHSRIVQSLNYMADEARGGRDARYEDMAKAFMERNHSEGPQFGTRRVGVDEFSLLLGTLHREIEADGGRLVLLSMPRTEELETSRPILLEYTDAVHRVADVHGIPVVDVRMLFRERQTLPASKKKRRLLLDNVHPTSFGHDLLARALATTIETAAIPQ